MVKDGLNFCSHNVHVNFTELYCCLFVLVECFFFEIDIIIPKISSFDELVGNSFFLCECV